MLLLKKIKTIIFPSVLVFFFISLNSNAQEVNCSENYETALRLYNYGMADSALNVLKPCLENKKISKKVSKETCANIFRLAALSSIMTGHPGEAEKYVKQLLMYKPDYKDNIRDDDLMEFRLMLDRTSAQPELKIGAKAGTNIPAVKLQKKYSDYETQGGDYSLEGSFGFQFGITGEKTLTQNISVAVEAGITRFQFKYESKGLGVQYQYDQSITYVEIPVLVKYHFVTNSSFEPYLQGGVSGKFLLTATEKSDVYGKYWSTKSSNSENILATFLTDIENIGFVIGGGVGYNLKNSSIRLDFRYIHNFESSSRSSKFDDIIGYDDIPVSEKFQYTNDINLINLKNIQISVGFVYNLKYKVF
ncbi:MAG: PorT family protein [Bacteroidales bacterium]|nr:PorT family protein [Bacteroidales bacterium]